MHKNKRVIFYIGRSIYSAIIEFGCDVGFFGFGSVFPAPGSGSDFSTRARGVPSPPGSGVPSPPGSGSNVSAGFGR